MGLLPFITKPVIRAAFGTVLAALYCVVFRDLMPFQRKSTNTLALWCLWQVMLTYWGALMVLLKEECTDVFAFEDYYLGVALVGRGRGERDSDRDWDRANKGEVSRVTSYMPRPRC